MAKWQVSVEQTEQLAEMTKELIAVSTVRPGQRIQRGINTTGRSLLTPGYNDAQRATYPAFWVRDPAWVAESNLIPAEEVWGWITLLTETMRGPEPWHLASGGVVLPYSLPDHINIDGSPVYYPGTYAAGLEPKVAPALVAERLAELRELQDEITWAKRDELIGSTVTALVERIGRARSHREAPEIDGIIEVPDWLEPGCFVDVRITAAHGPDLAGEPVGVTAAVRR